MFSGCSVVILDTAIFNSSGFSSEYFIWSDALGWEPQPTNGSSSSILSEEILDTLAVNIPVYLNTDELLGLTDAKGVMAVRSLPAGNPNDLLAGTIANTSIFTFSTPQ